MKIEKLWIVTYPTPISELADIMFETDLDGLSLQFLGGLRAQDIAGMFTTQGEAEKEAKALLGLRHQEITSAVKKGKGLYLTKVEMDIVSDVPLELISESQIQSPGPIDYLYEYERGGVMDPFVESVSSSKSKKMSEGEIKKRKLTELFEEISSESKKPDLDKMDPTSKDNWLRNNSPF